MPEEQQIGITLTADDLVTPHIKVIRERLDELGLKANIKLNLSANDLGRQPDFFVKLREGLKLFEDKPIGQQVTLWEKLTGKIGEAHEAASGFSGLLLANLSSYAIQGTIQGLVRLFSTLTSAIGQAASIQTEGITAVTRIGVSIGVSDETAKSVYDRIQDKISSDAASLPGTTEGYNKIFNLIAGTLGEQFKGHPEIFEKVAEDFTKRTGVLSAITHSNPENTGQSLNRLIGGTVGFQEGVRFGGFENAPEFASKIRQEAKKANINLEDWQKLNESTRTALIQRGLMAATTDKAIEAYNNTVEGTWQGIVTDWTDPTKGLFGFLRKVSAAGNRSVLDSVEGFLQSINSLDETFRKLKLGDPLTFVIGFFDWLADSTNRFNELISGVKLDKDTLTNVTEKAVKAFGDSLYAVVVGADYEKAGEATSDILKGFLKGLFSEKTLIALGYLTEAPFIFFGGFLTKIFKDVSDWIVDITKEPIDRIGEAFNNIYEVVKGWLAKIGINIGAEQPQQSIPEKPEQQKRVEQVETDIDLLQGITDPLGTLGKFGSEQVVDKVLPYIFPSDNAVHNTNVTVNAGAVTDHKELANTVMEHINNAYKDRKRSRL